MLAYILKDSQIFFNNRTSFFFNLNIILSLRVWVFSKLEHWHGLPFKGAARHRFSFDESQKCWLWSPCSVKHILQLQTIVMPHSSCCCRFSDSYIVRVKAVVMTRDDSSGGWFPQEGGGISRVGVCKVMHPEGNGRSGFLIHGERQKDKLVMADINAWVK